MLEDTEVRHIVVATDDRFALPTATTLRSLAQHDADRLTVWILTADVTNESKRQIEYSIPEDSIELRWLDMREADLGDTSASRLGRASFFRLAIGEVLPESITQVLYMDTDIVVNDSLAPLWSLPDQGEVLSAVRSVHFPSVCTWGAIDHWPELGLGDC